MNECRNLLRAVLVAILSGWFLTACAGDAVPTEYRYEVVETRPHDTRLFTQGLLIHKGLFYESGGRYGQSRLVAYPRRGDETTLEQRLPNAFFAEGLTELGDRLFLLTWRENTLLMFDADTLEPEGEHHYRGEGWGLTDDGRYLIRSDGSAQLYFHAPGDFTLHHQITVTERGRPLSRLNELEYIDGYLWANIWHDDRLVQIDPDTGRVVGTLDLSKLVRRENPRRTESVLNGIAFDPTNGHFWVTGKQWRHLYRLSLSPAIR